MNFLFAVQYPPANWSRPVYAEGTVAFEKEDLSTSSRMNAFMWSFLLFQAVYSHPHQSRVSKWDQVPHSGLLICSTEWHVSKIEESYLANQSSIKSCELNIAVIYINEIQVLIGILVAGKWFFYLWERNDVKI